MCSLPHTWKQIKSVTHWIGRWHIELFSTFPDEIYLASIPPSPPLASNGVLSSSRYSPRCGAAPQISLAFVSRGICLKREYKESFSFGPRVPPHHSKIEEPCLSPGQDEGEQDQHHIICDWLAVPLVLEHLWRTWWNFPNNLISSSKDHCFADHLGYKEDNCAGCGHRDGPPGKRVKVGNVNSMFR